MQYAVTTTPTRTQSHCLVIGLFKDHPLPDYVVTLDETHHGIISRLMTPLQEEGALAWQSDVAGQTLLLIQCGMASSFTSTNLTKRLTDITNHLLKERIISATLCIPPVNDHTANWQLQQMLLQIDAHCYQLLDFKTKNKKPNALQALNFYLPNADEHTLSDAQAIAEGVNFTRTLANLPANICTPSYLAEQAETLAKQHNTIKTCIFKEDQIKKMGMGALLAVSQGSSEPPRFIEVTYQGSKDAAPIILVGKGITFDSGGLSLKPAEAMTEMKYDMAGAASVLGTLKICALLNLPIHVIGLIASAENMMSGSAVKPGDIITTMSGQTVEIINTDAEGRLVLADALTYAERYKPDFVLDMATLTGAVIVALGNITTGFMTPDDALATLIMNAAKDSEDKAWRLPLDADYQEALESPLADMVNATFDRTAGSITAACFLSRFTERYRWAHLDIAGTAWISGKKRNATGRPVPLLVELLRHVARSR